MWPRLPEQSTGVRELGTSRTGERAKKPGTGQRGVGPARGLPEPRAGLPGWRTHIRPQPRLFAADRSGKQPASVQSGRPPRRVRLFCHVSAPAVYTWNYVFLKAEGGGRKVEGGGLRVAGRRNAHLQKVRPPERSATTSKDLAQRGTNVPLFCVPGSGHPLFEGQGHVCREGNGRWKERQAGRLPPGEVLRRRCTPLRRTDFFGGALPTICTHTKRCTPLRRTKFLVVRVSTTRNLPPSALRLLRLPPAPGQPRRRSAFPRRACRRGARRACRPCVS